MENEEANLNFEKDSRILIVDDNPQNIQVIGNILRERGFKISIAMNGKEALNFVAKTLPDLILLDVMMPEMDGYEACEKLKSNKDTKDIPVIFITAKVELEDMIRGFEIGGVDYVTKPFRKEELLARVRTHLRLRKTELELIELLNMKDKLFSIIGHDLRGPLGTLMMMMDSFVDPNSRYSEADTKKYMAALKDSSFTAYTLLENLLNWARSEQKMVSFVPAKINIKDIIEENMKLLYGGAANKSIEIIPDIDESLIGYFDRNTISTVVRNLISNALKFTNIGGKITIEAVQKGKDIQISVSDDGVGMSKESMEKLFRKNILNSTRGTKGEKGTGIGLHLCKDFVEGNKGQIWVESEVNKGSKFIFTVPSA